jgi:hypothetical protein
MRCGMLPPPKELRQKPQQADINHSIEEGTRVESCDRIPKNQVDDFIRKYLSIKTAVYVPDEAGLVIVGIGSKCKKLISPELLDCL